ncbi:hypothetical protein FHU36_000881 [Nonomuraea muscovyensis]|uniref:Uncharacterized protein n=1 Tax=Nonomuraea muscovyensis TaxID=1124761 RepID=A0A7X0EU45_9ACTN|nr:hypothetical protein [Nonomuraea muscovyensis]
MLAKQHDEWTEGRRNLGLEVLAECRKAAEKTEPEDSNDVNVTVDTIAA